MDCRYGKTQHCLFWAKETVCFHPDNEEGKCDPAHCPLECEEEEKKDA